MKRTSLLWAGLLAFVLAAPAFAQQTPPAGSEPKPFNVPAKSTFSLDNGLTVTLVPYGNMPKVTVSATIRLGNINETRNQLGLVDLMGDLMKEGTTTRSAEDIAKEAASMGGSVNIFFGLDQGGANGDVLSEYGADLVNLIADILRNPAFPEDQIERLKRDRLRQISISKTQPGSIALARFREVMYGEHRYGQFFTPEELMSGYTADDVQAFYNDNMGAARTHIYVAGQFNVSQMRTAIQNAFGDWNRGPDPLMNVPAPQSSREIHIVDMPGAAQSNVYIGLPTIDPSHDDYVALQVTNALLGGSFASRITSNIREQKGYTYSPFSQISTRYRDAYWAQVAAITTKDTGAAIQEIFYEINRLQDEPPSQDELEGIQNYMAGTFVLQNSSRGGIIGQLSFLNLHGIDDSYLTNYVNSIYAVTPEEVQRIVQTYLRDEDMVIVMAADEEAVAPQVAQFGNVVN